MSDQKVMLSCKDVSIRYMVGDFKAIGLKEWVVRRLTGRYHVKEFWADKDVVFSINEGDMLGIIGADDAMLELESIRVSKEMHGDIMRKINCDYANVDRTLSAAEEQKEWLRVIASAETGRQAEADEISDPASPFWTQGLRMLPAPLKEVAYLRLYKPEASLTEIGEALTPPLGKAAVSKRFAKLRALAEGE
jgi:hypothetical protein